MIVVLETFRRHESAIGSFIAGVIAGLWVGAGVIMIIIMGKW